MNTKQERPTHIEVTNKCLTFKGHPLDAIAISDDIREAHTEAERDALREFADRKTRAILAIFTSRRSSGKKEFFVPPHIAELYRLTPRDLAWAYEKLEGLCINTVNSKMGKFRIVRLTDEWEARESQETKVSKQVVSNKDSNTLDNE